MVTRSSRINKKPVSHSDVKFRESPLWDYVTQLYSLPEVEKTCLALQQQQGADVNVLLLACWLGNKQMRITPELLQQIQSVSQPWQENILQPMRKARLAIKEHILLVPTDQLEQTRSNMLKMELNAEHMQVLALEDSIQLESLVVDSKAGVEDITSSNLWLYLDQLNSTNEELRPQLGSLLTAVFGTEEVAQLAFMTAT